MRMLKTRLQIGNSSCKCKVIHIECDVCGCNDCWDCGWIGMHVCREMADIVGDILGIAQVESVECAVAKKNNVHQEN